MLIDLNALLSELFCKVVLAWKAPNLNLGGFGEWMDAKLDHGNIIHHLSPQALTSLVTYELAFVLHCSMLFPEYFWEVKQTLRSPKSPATKFNWLGLSFVWLAQIGRIFALYGTDSQALAGSLCLIYRGERNSSYSPSSVPQWLPSETNPMVSWAPSSVPKESNCSGSSQSAFRCWSMPALLILKSQVTHYEILPYLTRGEKFISLNSQFSLFILSLGCHPVYPVTARPRVITSHQWKWFIQTQWFIVTSISSRGAFDKNNNCNQSGSDRKPWIGWLFYRQYI